ncbi:sugar ABC transporter permease [Bacillus gobiensis]|uniref:Sugar ABC transporter permease n=1 Tax=Bacillus gobiensis TaxID=1441095 RepID=A0A0M4FDV3_9BACI|nr:sugar ABC transporter permease [Bacillus gobiensis]
MIVKRLTLSIKYTFMAALALIALVPILWMVLGSFRSYQEIFQYATSLNIHLLLPVEWTLQNYIDVIFDEQNPIFLFIGNTLFVTIIVTILVLFINSMAAFAFAKLEFPFKNVIFVCFMSAMIIPGEVTLVPNYLLMNDLGWVNDYKALIFPSLVHVFGIFLLRQFFSEIPKDMIEAARLDGASWFRIYWNIILPSAVPALITLGIITFLANWDAYFWPLIVINDEPKQLIQVAIANYSSLAGNEWAKILAANTISTIPIIIAFLFLQKYYIRGISMTGMK